MSWLLESSSLRFSSFVGAFDNPIIDKILNQNVLITTPTATKNPIIKLTIALPEPGSMYADADIENSIIDEAKRAKVGFFM